MSDEEPIQPVSAPEGQPPAPVSGELPLIPADAWKARGAYWRLMRNNGFRNMWIGQTISGVGDWLVFGLLLPVVMNLAPGSSMAVAGIMIAKIIPSLLMGPLLGVLVDRWDRRRLMIACDVINGILCLGLVTASAASVIPPVGRLAIIYGTLFIMEIFSLMFVPAKNALIPMIVDERDLASANGLSYTTQQVSMVIGLVASSAIIAVFGSFLMFLIGANVPFVKEIVAAQPGLIGPQGGIVVDSFSFLLSAVLIWTIKVRRTEKHLEKLNLRLVGRDIVESFVVLREAKELRGILISLGLAILGGGALTSVGLYYVQRLTGNVPVVGLVQSIQKIAEQSRGIFMLVFLAIGTFAGAVITPWLANKISLERLFVSGIGGFGVGLMAFSLVDDYTVAAFFAVAAGYLMAQGSVASNTYIVETVADNVRGRVFAALESIIRVGFLASVIVTAPLGDLIGGVLTKAVIDSGGDPARFSLPGPRVTLVFASLIVLGAAVYAAFKVDWRTKHAPGDHHHG